MHEFYKGFTLNFEIVDKYDFKECAIKLRQLSDVLDSIGIIGQDECNKFIQENNLEYCKDEVTTAFRQGFFTAINYMKHKEIEQ